MKKILETFISNEIIISILINKKIDYLYIISFHNYWKKKIFTYFYIKFAILNEMDLFDF